MGFEKFGRKSFTAVTKVGEYVDKLESGEVYTTHCPKCNKTYFPPRMDCPGCLSGSLEWVKVPDTGKLVTFTNVKYAPTGFEGDLPYLLAVVDFGGFRMFGRLSDSMQGMDIKVGMTVKPVVVNYENGQIAHEFVAAE
ncbi:MAG TPA: DNA-binding protein [Desulfotomaculum sp.]|nr:DNA-binding protein [Desulfotomaculum sp.]